MNAGSGPWDRRSCETPVFITAELASREARQTDWIQAKSALNDLTTRMAESPADVLPKLVELAMKITGGSSGGLSIYEAEPAPGIFRWLHLCGSLARFDGGTTPRNDSPCGVTLDERAPVLVQRPERRYKWLRDAGISLPEVLLVPLYLGTSEPLGTLWIVSDTENHFDSGHASVLIELAAYVGTALRMKRNREKLRAALQAQISLTHDTDRRLQSRTPAES